MNGFASPPRITRPVNGARSLFAEIPDVHYCRRCHRRLFGTGSIEAGIGRRCARSERRELAQLAKVQLQLFGQRKR